MAEYRRLTDFNNVPATGLAALSSSELDNLSVHALHFELGGGALTRAMLTNLRIKVAGEPIVDNLSAARLQLINNWKGCNTGDVTRVSWYFGNPEAVTERDKHYTDLDLAIYKSKDGKTAAKIEIQWDVTGATTPTIKTLAEVYAPKQDRGFTRGGAGLVKRFYRSSYVEAGALNQVNRDVNIGRADNAAVLNEFLFNANLTDVEVIRDQQTIWQRLTPAEANSIQLDKGHPTQGGMYVISPTYEGHMDQSWPSAGEYQHKITSSGADTFDFFVEAAVGSLTRQRAA